MPDLLRAYGDLMRGDGSAIYGVLTVVVLVLTALVALLAIGSLCQRIVRALGHARGASRHVPRYTGSRPR